MCYLLQTEVEASGPGEDEFELEQDWVYTRVYTLLKMGRYYNTTMRHYWDMLVK